jgi:RNA polymerase sigma-70 factor (ECF subfamily)
VNDPSDEQLMSQVAAGRMEALETVYLRYERPLMAFFLRGCGDRTIAEDLLQEVFLRILKYRSSYDPARRVRSWIFGIAHNVAIDAARKREVERAGLPAAAGSPNPIDSPDPLDGVVAERRAQRVRRALDRLSVTDRQVLILAKVEELAYADIAGILACSEGSVKVRVHRALGRLADHLADGAEGAAG